MKKIIFSAAVLTAAFATAQNTGIGTTAPTQKLDVNGSVRTRGQFIQDKFDFVVGIGDQVSRGNSGPSRAVVKGNIIDSQGNPIPRLILNFSNDYPAGTQINGNINLPNIGAGSAGDSVVVMDDNFNLLKVPASSWAASNAINIYNSNGKLTSERTIDQNGYIFNFSNGNVRVGGGFSTEGSAGIGGFDFALGNFNQTLRGDSGASRALVKNGDATNGSQLFVNYGNDFSAGTRVDSKLYISNTTGAADAANDKILTIGNNGEVKNSATTLGQVASASEPWYVANTTTPATANNQSIYQMGNVGIGIAQPISKLHLRYVQDPAITTDQGYANDIVFDNFEPTTNDGLSLVFRRYRGTEAAPQNIAVGDRIGGFNFGGYINGTDKNNGTIGIIHKGFVNNSQKSAMYFSINDGESSTPSLYLAETQNVGVNTTSPSQQLDVNGNARVRQMPATNDEATYSRVVVADTNGNLATVSRTDPGVPNATETIFANPAVSTDVMPTETFLDIQNNMDTRGVQYFRPAGRSITLPPGKWILYCGYLINPKPAASNPSGSPVLENGTSVWLRAIISADNNPTLGISSASASINNGPSQISKSLTDHSLYEMATGVWLVDNTGNTDKTYYVKISLEPYGFNTSNDKDLNNLSAWGEDYLFAIKRK